MVINHVHLGKFECNVIGIVGLCFSYCCIIGVGAINIVGVVGIILFVVVEVPLKYDIL